MPCITFLDRDGNAVQVDAPVGLSVMEAGRRAGVDIEGRCESSLACSTCHVVVDPGWFDRLSEPSLDEQDMLDLVTVGLSATSRLCCQIMMSSDLDGLIVRLPPVRHRA